MDHKTVREALRQISALEGISETKIRNDIALAISYFIKSNRQDVQNFLKTIPCEGDSPTIDEITDYIIVALFQSEY